MPVTYNTIFGERTDADPRDEDVRRAAQNEWAQFNLATAMRHGAGQQNQALAYQDKWNQQAQNNGLSIAQTQAQLARDLLDRNLADRAQDREAEGTRWQATFGETKRFNDANLAALTPQADYNKFMLERAKAQRTAGDAYLASLANDPTATPSEKAAVALGGDFASKIAERRMAREDATTQGQAAVIAGRLHSNSIQRRKQGLLDRDSATNPDVRAALAGVDPGNLPSIDPAQLPESEKQLLANEIRKHADQINAPARSTSTTFTVFDPSAEEAQGRVNEIRARAAEIAQTMPGVPQAAIERKLTDMLATPDEVPWSIWNLFGFKGNDETGLNTVARKRINEGRF